MLKSLTFLKWKKTINEMEHNIKYLVAAESNNDDEIAIKSFRFKHGNGYGNVRLNSSIDFPYVVYCNEDENKKFMSCVYLFIGEAITLLKYLNTRFEISQTDNLKLKQEKNHQMLRTDNFFNCIF